MLLVYIPTAYKDVIGTIGGVVLGISVATWGILSEAYYSAKCAPDCWSEDAGRWFFKALIVSLSVLLILCLVTVIHAYVYDGFFTLTFMTVSSSIWSGQVSSLSASTA